MEIQNILSLVYRKYWWNDTLGENSSILNTLGINFVNIVNRVSQEV